MTQPHEHAAPLTLTSRDISRGIATAMDRAQLLGQRTVLTRRGKPAAALVSLDDLARLEQLSAAGVVPSAPTAQSEAAPEAPAAESSSVRTSPQPESREA